MFEWLDLNNHQWNWNAGLNTPVCPSSPLRRLSLFVGPWVQRRGLIKAWLWFTLSDQGEETQASVITEHWACINSNHSTIRRCHVPHKVCYTPGLITVIWVLLITRDISASFMAENTVYFMIKSATGSNALIVFKGPGWRAERYSLLCKTKKE